MMSPRRSRNCSGKNRSPTIDCGRCPSLHPATIRCGASSQVNSSQPWISTAAPLRSGNTASWPTASKSSANASSAGTSASLIADSHSRSRSMKLRAVSRYILSIGFPSRNSRLANTAFRNPARPRLSRSRSKVLKASANRFRAVRATIRF